MPWVIASLIAATSVFGKPAPQNLSQCAPKPACPQPCPPTQVCPSDPCCPAWPTPVLNAAYNYPARIQTRCPWDIYADASFIYWQPIQENMELGYTNTIAPSAGAVSGVIGDFINMDFSFKPGFKVGLGGNFDYDNWDLHLEYTWFHSSHSKSAVHPTDGQLLPDWGLPFSSSSIFVSTINEDWHLKMDILQLDLGRWNYVGTKFTCHPYVGARAAWIRQNVHVVNTNDGTIGIATTLETTVRGRTLSWAVGPEVGVDSNWNLGAGFRMYGNAEGDILFTRYTKARYSETHSNGSDPVITTQRNINALRGHVDLELGFGWGTYIDCNNWYLDFSAGYGFQIFFDQNMFRSFHQLTDSSLPYGNLYVQGLTTTFRLDF